MATSLLDALRERVLLSDGAMGTQLMNAGLESGGCGEAWNIEHPDRVLAIQKRYVEAGSDCLITNTFGGCRIMLDRHEPGMDVAAINAAAVRIAREAFGERSGFVLGDVGPFGGLMEPYGDFGRDKVYEAFLEQARALVEAGADAIIIETQTVPDELGVAIDAAREAGAAYIIASMAFDLTNETRELRTMMGTTPEDAVHLMAEKKVDVVATNCGTGVGMKQAADVVRRYRACCDLPVMAQPNAGNPVLEKMKVVFKQTPQDMAADAGELLEAGANIIGGCCGSTPEHVRALRAVLDERTEKENHRGTEPQRSQKQ